MINPTDTPVVVPTDTPGPALPTSTAKSRPSEEPTDVVEPTETATATPPDTATPTISSEISPVPTDTAAVPTLTPTDTAQPPTATPTASATPTQTPVVDVSGVTPGRLPHTGESLRDQGVMGDLGGLVATAIGSVLVLLAMVLGMRLRRRSYATWPGVIDEPEIGAGSYSEPYRLSSKARWKGYPGHPPGERHPPEPD
ncbi:MAG TPA: hypothetical protein VGE04_03055 [Chloroflexia bacterium]